MAKLDAEERRQILEDHLDSFTSMGWSVTDRGEFSATVEPPLVEPIKYGWLHMLLSLLTCGVWYIFVLFPMLRARSAKLRARPAPQRFTVDSTGQIGDVSLDRRRMAF